MSADLLDKLRKKMEDTTTSLKRDLDSISTGRANPNLLDAIRVEIYGSQMPISQLANISASDSSTLNIQAWDRESLKPIEKAIIAGNLGFTPIVDGNLIRISIPKLSEERRKELVKLAKKYGEEKKVALRNVRRDILDDFKKLEKEFGKDQIQGFCDLVQKTTDDFVKKLDDMISQKEKELMKI